VPWLVVVIIASLFTNRLGLPLLPLAEWVGYLIGAVLAALGVLLLALGLKASSFRILIGRDKSALVTRGIYSYIRHPFCFSCILLAFSAAVGLRSAVGLMIAILALVIIYVRASFEEKELERRFGQEYCEYKSKVEMFIPKRKRTRSPG
jgi:protein-S-isoprenylcysteine O-methyltransferase Ste14